MAVSRYGDGVQWHDTACYRAKQFICEDSDKMVSGGGEMFLLGGE